MRNQSVDDLTVGLRPRHPHDQRYADPAVGQIAFIKRQRYAVIGREHHDCLLHQSRFLQLGDDLAEILIHVIG